MEMDMFNCDTVCLEFFFFHFSLFIFLLSFLYLLTCLEFLINAE
jgi:hypothetical protein